MVLQAVHRTLYEYPFPSVDSHNEVRLMPLSDEHQTCSRFKLEVHPNTRVFQYADFGGVVHHFGIREPHRRLEIIASATVETKVEDPFRDLNLIHDDWEFYEAESTRQSYVEYLIESSYIPLLPDVYRIVEEVRKPRMSAARFLIDITNRVHGLLSYDPDATHVYSTLRDVLSMRAGVCQDFAHLCIACCRAAGIPARYVSGYLYAGSGSGIRGDQATHAWVECLLPDGRWLSMDPTNNLLAGEQHIRVHLGRDYSDVSPTRGVYVGAQATRLNVSVSVTSASDRIEQTQMLGVLQA